VENWFPYWRSWPGRIGEELEAQGFASPSIVVVAEVVAEQVVAQRVEASAPEPADTELPIPF
jgi:uroporphyrin-III C-methyltransferase